MNRYLLAGASVIGLLAIGAPEAKAQNLQEIQAQIDQMQATIKALQKQVQDAKAQASAASDDRRQRQRQRSRPEGQMEGRTGAPSGDGKFKMKVRGRLEVDYNHVDQDTLITSFPDARPPNCRRARPRRRRRSLVRLEIRCRSRFRQRFAGMKDAYLHYQGLQSSMTNLQLSASGNFKHTNTTLRGFRNGSDRFVDTMERAASSTAWDIERQIGFMGGLLRAPCEPCSGIFGECFPSMLMRHSSPRLAQAERM